MIKSILTNSKDKKSLQTLDGWEDLPVLVIANYQSMNGSFKSIARSTAGTSTLTEPTGEGSIVLTDLIITTDKVNGASVTVQFTDDTNTIVIVAAQVTDAPCNIATTFIGHWQGWRSARMDMVTVGNVKATVACGYFKVSKSKSLEFSDWDARR